ncbi:hypothetical protein E1301_Tti011386 [Triplophysa tibetana]|uniref:Uncharacterized protein n=1 Tax=Triplophysa tibetana TaxID=1572043 RepID=A0A5A9PB02_9TELE|nr:hypothetical protein E1301_Tti011386 [Triplophysa tibetana]
MVASSWVASPLGRRPELEFASRQERAPLTNENPFGTPPPFGTTKLVDSLFVQDGLFAINMLTCGCMPTCECLPVDLYSPVDCYLSFVHPTQSNLLFSTVLVWHRSSAMSGDERPDHLTTMSTPSPSASLDPFTTLEPIHWLPISSPETQLRQLFQETSAAKLSNPCGSCPKPETSKPTPHSTDRFPDVTADREPEPSVTPTAGFPCPSWYRQPPP